VSDRKQRNAIRVRVAAGTEPCPQRRLQNALSPFTYLLKSISGSFTDPAFAQCSIDRPQGASAQGRMVLVNHFLDLNISGILIPNRGAANVTNSAASITAQANICVGLYGRKPNFILVCSIFFFWVE
jgi:hypothetical protein